MASFLPWQTATHGQGDGGVFLQVSSPRNIVFILSDKAQSPVKHQGKNTGLSSIPSRAVVGVASAPKAFANASFIVVISQLLCWRNHLRRKALFRLRSCFSDPPRHPTPPPTPKQSREEEQGARGRKPDTKKELMAPPSGTARLTVASCCCAGGLGG